jgi:hypothetical protein
MVGVLFLLTFLLTGIPGGHLSAMRGMGPACRALAGQGAGRFRQDL